MLSNILSFNVIFVPKEAMNNKIIVIPTKITGVCRVRQIACIRLSGWQRVPAKAMNAKRISPIPRYAYPSY